MSLRPASAIARQLFARTTPFQTNMGASSYMVSRFMGGAAGSFLDKGEVTDRVVNVVKGYQKVTPDKVSPTSHFMNDLDLDSLDAVELVMMFEDEFCVEIPDEAAEKIQTCTDAIEYIAAHPQAK